MDTKTEKPGEQLVLLAAPESVVESPNEALKEAARTERIRRLCRLRQKRCRAAKKLRARVEAAQAVVSAEDAKFAERAKWSPEKLIAFHRALYLIWGAMQLGGPLTARVFEVMEPGDFDAPHDLVYEAARSLHRRGARVTREALLKELKANGVILLHDRELSWFDGVLESPLVPRHVTARLIDEGAELLKEA